MKVNSVIVISDSDIGKKIQTIFEKGKLECRKWRPEDLLFQRMDSVDLVVEAVEEDLHVKGEVLEKIGRGAPINSIIATTTYLFSVTALGTKTGRPAKFAGLHLCEPIESNPICEVVKGLETSEETAGSLFSLIEVVGKTPVMVKDSPGFILNRVMASMINEATNVLMYGIASVEDIDKMMQLGGNWPKGPFQFADEIGLDRVLAVLERLYQEMGPNYRPCPLLRQKVQAGHLGKKAGRGFYPTGSSAKGTEMQSKSGEVPQAELKGIKRISVLGAGIMGHGIAQVAAQAGFEVIMMDVSEDIVKAGLKKIEDFLAKGIEKGKMTREEADKVISRIHTETELKSAVKDADFVIEAVIEDLAVKKEIFREIDSICRPEVIFASNTSQLSITEMASSTRRADRFIGMHWFNPPQIMRGIELVMGVSTSEDTLRTTEAICRIMKKEPAVCRVDSPGFVVTRILQPWYNEGMHMLDEGVATTEDIDKAVRLGGGFPMGPLQLRDLVGLDTALKVAKYMAEALGDRFRPPSCLIRNVAAGHLGRKTKRGFYKY